MLNQTQKEDLQKRLVRIEGQTRGIQKMIEDDRYCIDTLTQTRAIISALKKVENIIMNQHINTCVVESLSSDNDNDKKEKIDEVMKLLSWVNN